jgi:Rrf2 family protein
MKITALEEYGLRCMVLLAKNGRENMLTIPEIGQMEGLSVPYTGKLLMLLKKADLVDAERGRRGGYFLARPPREIALREVFDALGDPVFGAAHCNRYGTGDGGGSCLHENCCTVRTVWDSFKRLINDYLERLTLADLIENNRNLVGASESDEGLEEAAVKAAPADRDEFAENRTIYK